MKAGAAVDIKSANSPLDFNHQPHTYSLIMTTTTRTPIVFGAGPGIGNHVAAEFASKDINHIILLSRNTQRLQKEDAPFVSAASKDVKVDILQIDLSDLASIPAVLKELDNLTTNESVEIIFFNAARIHPSPILSTPVQEIDEDLRTTTLSLYLIAQHFLPHLTSLSQSSASTSSPLKPALLVTNSALPHSPVPELLSLSLVKAAQRNMVQSLRLAFGEKGVHVGLVSVEGVVGMDEEVRNPKNIARRTVEFWERGEGLEVRI
ncbi:hypothetical protein HBI38_069840 [Parastagonospora nodorum]|nr:hypothetical protein HBI06_127030 [Parastagonospora nodorum]KAH4241477.1 hypothetical protein HBI05_096950 [Parastagonospora nodorum]KAH5027990.1 hypothetical protein HBI74_115110 [Parastagonospora nodorum]KAH5164866.1 hypothetical protein HBI73_037970 [Parastagonospora nodorum]KAH6273569.1 hypothetical protein HBI41_071070 [Parastagonospora nodorum]